MQNPNIPKPDFCASRIKDFRERRHLSQQQFADIANTYASMYGTKVTKKDISCYENAKYCPKIDKLTAISNAMGVDLDFFCGYGAKNRRLKKNTILKQYEDAHVDFSVHKVRKEKKS